MAKFNLFDFLHKEHEKADEARRQGNWRKAQVHEAIISGTQAAKLPEVKAVRDWSKRGGKNAG